MHYTNDGSEKEDFAKTQEDFIHRTSRVPLKQEPNRSLDEFRKDWAPFSGAMLAQQQQKTHTQTEMKSRKKMEVRQTLESKFTKLCQVTTPRKVIDSSAFLSPAPASSHIADQSVLQLAQRPTQQHCPTAFRPTPEGSPRATPAATPSASPDRRRGNSLLDHQGRKTVTIAPRLIPAGRRASESQVIFPHQLGQNADIKSAAKPVLLLPQRMAEQRSRLQKVKETLVAHMKTLKERKSAAAQSAAKKQYRASAIAECMGCVPLKVEEMEISASRAQTAAESRKLDNGRDSTSTAINTVRDTSKMALEGKNFTLLNENFGIEHSRARETEREAEREQVRQAVVVPEIVKLQDEYDNRKDKLYIQSMPTLVESLLMSMRIPLNWANTPRSVPRIFRCTEPD